MAAILYLVFSGASAWLILRGLEVSPLRTIRVLAGLVLWALLYLLPVHLLATLQIAGWIQRVDLKPLAYVEAAVLAAAGIWSFLRRQGHPVPSQAEPAAGSPALPTYVVAGIILVAGTALIFAVRLLVSFPDDSDALVYHIPVAVHWLQEGSLRIPDSHVWEFSLPANTEIGMMLLLAAGAQRLLALVNVLAAAILALSAFLIAKKCHPSRAAALSATLIALSLPIVQFQAFSAYVDIFGAAFIVAGAALFLYRYEGVSDPASGGLVSLPILSLSALACGISIGSKHPYYFYGAVYFVVAAAILVRERRVHKRLATCLLVVVLGTLLPSAFWFGRAWQATGNPVYPQRVAIGSHVLLDGYASITPEDFEENFVRSRPEWLIYAWTEWKKNRGYLLIPYSTGSGLGAAFAAFVPLGIVFAFRSSFASAPKAWSVLKALTVLLVPLLICWWFALRRMPRFGLPLWVLACLLCTPLLAALGEGRFRRLFGAVFVLSLLSTSLIAGFVPAHAVLSALREHDYSRAKFYDYPRIIDSFPPGTRLVNDASSEYNFVLSGARLTNRVIPEFELPSTLSPPYLHKVHADLVVERLDAAQDAPPPPCSGLDLIHEEVVKVGDTGRRDRWRIWQVQ